MKPQNTEIIAQLQLITEDVSFASENDYPFKVFVHEVDTQGELTLEKLLETNNHLSLVNKDDFLKTIREVIPENIQSYIQVIDLVESEAGKLEIYQIQILDESGKYEAFNIFLIETFDGNWLGFSPQVDTEPSSRRSEKLPLEFDDNFGDSVISLKAKLETLLINLKFVVLEYYEPNKIKEDWVLEIGKTKSEVITKLLDSLGFLKICNFKTFNSYLDFDEKDYADNPEFLAEIKQIHQQYQSLDNLLTSKLTNLREYILGGMAVYYLYNIGETQDGDFVGVSTTAIWT
jgi:Nuclease A inhibitor-like protein